MNWISAFSLGVGSRVGGCDVKGLIVAYISFYSLGLKLVIYFG